MILGRHDSNLSMLRHLGHRLGGSIVRCADVGTHSLRHEYFSLTGNMHFFASLRRHRTTSLPALQRDISTGDIDQPSLMGI
jgi:hypothetical protein